MISSLIPGILAGLTYGLLGLGLVLIYKVDRFINIAHAQMGVLSAVVLAKLVVDGGWPYWPAFLVSVTLGVAIALVIERLVVRPLRDRNATTLLIASLGVAQVLIAATYVTALKPDSQRLAAEGYPVPFDVRIEIGTFVMRGHNLLTLVLAPSLVAAIAVTFRWTIFGRLTRATATNPDRARLCGVPVHRVSMGVWAAAGVLSAITAILQAPNQTTFQLDALGPGLLLWVLGAAAIGRFTSLVGTFAAGIAIGVLEGLMLYLTKTATTAQAIVFVVLLVVLLVMAWRSRTSVPLERPDVPTPVPATAARVQARPIVRLRRPFVWAAAIAVGCLAPFVPPLEAVDKRFTLSLVLIYALVALSVTVLTGWNAQLSLGQIALVGVGAFLSVRLTDAGWSFPAQVLAAGLVCGLVSVVLGLPALRGHGATFLVTSLGFGVVAAGYLFRPNSWLTGRGSRTPEPATAAGLGPLASTLDVYFAALVVLTLAAGGLAALRNTGAGRMILAVRDNPVAAASLGVSPTRYRMLAFAVAGFLGGVAGVLWAAAFHGAAQSMFPAGQSFLIIAIATIGGLGAVAGAVLGSLTLVAIPEWTEGITRSLLSDAVGFQLFLSGVGVVTTQLYYPRGIVGYFQNLWSQIVSRIARDLGDADVGGDEPRRADAPVTNPQPVIGRSVGPAEPASQPDADALVVQGVSLNFGGIQALLDVSMHVRANETVGLIGTNGAGKTTLLNVISGNFEPTAGSVWISGVDISALAPHRRAHAGLSRSYQDAALFAGMTVRETVQVALCRKYPAGALAAVTGLPAAASVERASRDEALDLVHRMGLGAWADYPIASLSTGTRRLCDLAAQVATRPRVLLLDEPTAGIAQREVEAFAELLRQVKAELACAIVIVEHDMPLVMSISDRIYALEAGCVISSGSPTEVRNDPTVIASYLGTSKAAFNRSGRPDNGAEAGARSPLRNGDHIGART